MLGTIARTYPAPAWARRARGAGTVLRIRNAYESASVGRRTRGWTAPTLGANDSTLPSLRTLRDRSRKAYRDDPYAGAALDYRVEQLVGCGLTPRSQAPDPAVRAAAHALFARWTQESDADGQLDFYGQQTQSVLCWQEAGEIFVRRRDRRPADGLSVPLQVQLLEPEFCPLDHSLTAASSGHRVRAGIELSPIGRRAAYWFYRQRPGEPQDLSPAELVRVEADHVSHLYLPARAGQLRGAPHLHRSLMALRDLDIGDDATLIRWQLGNMLVGWMTREGGDGATAPTLDPRTGKPIVKNADGVPLITMEPGAFYDLEPGEDLKFSEPPEAGATYEAFVRQQLRKASAGTRTPYYAITGDMSQVNDRTIRVILQDFRRGLAQLQEQIITHKFCRPIWTWWFEAAVISGALAVPAEYFDDRARWQAVEWVPDRFDYINPVQDVESDVREIRAGLSSRTKKVKGRGYDVEDIDRERKADNDREDAAGLASDSDARKTSRSGTGQSAPPADPENDRDEAATDAERSDAAAC